MDNFFPGSTGARLRRGKELYATLEDIDLDVRTLFSYKNGIDERMFGANDNTIYDLTDVLFPEAQDLGTGEAAFVTETGDILGWSSTAGLDVAGGYTSGDWSVIQFATTGGIYLVGVNGVDTGFIYDGTEFWPNVAGGMWYLPLASETVPFVEGEIVTGGTSGAVATVYRDDTTQLVISSIVEQPLLMTLGYDAGTAEFTVGSTLTGGDSGASGRIDTITPDPDVLLLDYDAGTALFAAAEVVTGGTSGATGTVESVDGTAATGTLRLTGVVGTFEDNEALTGSAAGAATANGAGAVQYSGTLTLSSVVGDFIDNEAIADGSGGAALANGAQAYSAGGPFQAGEALTGSVAGDAVADGGPTSAVPGMDFGGLDSSDMSFAWAYKNRLWFIQKESLVAWYLDVDAIGGGATPFPMGGIFANGGALLFGARWSLESGEQGGLSEQNVFVTTNGEVAIYQGNSPDSAATWALTGVYRIGSPLGKRAYLRGGGDLAIATTVGLVPLSKAISLDVTALNVATVSYKIADAWTDALQMRGDRNWQAIVWPESKLAAISPPDMVGTSDPVIFISNAETGAWARYTNWHALCLETFRGRLYFGSPEGKVFQANAGGLDDGEPYTGIVIPLHSDLGAPSASKIGKMARAITRSNAEITDRTDILTDYNVIVPAAPDASPLTGTNTWGDGVWGTSKWSTPTPTNVGANWKSAGGYGFTMAPCYQVTSGSVAPLDVELISMETLHTTTEVVG